ncbi:hypothetical protein [Thiohalophilus sp.]|uniref:hypothetical protein n=1 Tax=Thiohalophilus sp. TaxID=3028392 RepID=UPI002ACD5726|nr:hypothetical protein [Thiohalophilus sp.]MDZ7803115.1 hypothetical protein [Thiohalophilus sp.]
MSDNKHTDALRAHLESKHSKAAPGVHGLSVFTDLAVPYFEGDPSHKPDREDLDRAISGAENSLFAIHNGLRGIGQLMTTVAVEAHPMDADLNDPAPISSLTLQDVSGLIEQMAQTAGSLTDTLDELRAARTKLSH